MHEQGKLLPKIIDFVQSHLGEELRDERQRTILQKNTLNALHKVDRLHRRVEELFGVLASEGVVADLLSRESGMDEIEAKVAERRSERKNASRRSIALATTIREMRDSQYPPS